MRGRTRESGKKDGGKQKFSIPARVFGTAALAAGLALCPIKDSNAQDKTPEQEKILAEAAASKKKFLTMHVCLNGIKNFKDSVSPEEKNLCPATMDAITKKDPEKADNNISAFSKLSGNPNFRIEILEALDSIIEKSEGEYIPSVLASLNLILENPNYNPDVLKTIKLIAERPSKDSARALSAVSSILGNKNYSPELLGTVNAVIKKYGENSSGPLQMIRNMIETYDLKVDIKSEDFTKKVFSVSDVIFSKYGENSYYTFSIFGLLARKKSFNEELFDADYVEQVSSLLYPVAAKGEDVMKAMLVLLLHGKSDLSTILFATDIVEKTSTNSAQALILVFTALSNENLVPEVCTDHFVKDFSYIVNHIAGQNPGHEKEVLLAFRKILKSPNFKAEMLDEKYAGMINILAQKIAENGKNPFDYESFLENWGAKPKMPDKKFEEQYDETVEFILNKTDAKSKDVILAMNEVVRNPNFKPVMFDTIKSIIEKTTVESNPNNPWVKYYNMSKASTDAPKYLLGFEGLLDNYKFDSQMLPLVLLIVENKCNLNVLDEMIWNSDFKAKAITEESTAEAKKFIEKLNHAAALKKDENTKAMNANDFEILMNFSYALDTIGEEKVKVIHETYGIAYFGRYTEKLLNHLYESAADPGYKKDSPVLLAVFNKNDWNQAFYWDGHMLNKFMKYYNVMVFETDNEKGFSDAISNTAKEYQLIDTLIVAGHGHKTTVNFGPGGSEDNYIDLKDEEELKKLKSSFTDNPTIIMISCSTGYDEKGIAAKLSDIWDGTAWAPDKTTNLKNIAINKTGKIVNVKYREDATNKFVNGDMVLKNGKPVEKQPPEKSLEAEWSIDFEIDDPAD